MASALQNRSRHHGRRNPRQRLSREERAMLQTVPTKRQAKALAKKAKQADKRASQKQKRADLAAKRKQRRQSLIAKRKASRAERKAKRQQMIADRKAKRLASSSKRKASRKASRKKTSARRAYVSKALREADAECKKLVTVKVMCPPKRRKEVIKAARAAAKKAIPNRSRARHNGISALQNRSHARRNGAMSAVKSYASDTLPWIVGGIGGFALHAVADSAAIQLPKKIEGLALKIPGTAGRVVASASNTIQGAIVAAALGAAAKMIGGKAAPYIKDTAISALVIGVVYDAQRIMIAKEKAGKWALPSELGDLAFGDLAFGDLAFGDLAFGDLGFNQAGTPRSSDLIPMAGVSALGDGMAYETAPLTADYSQASLGDAMHCGADFSAAEGQAMINGRGHYMHRYGAPPHRMQHNPKGASHLAGREGHRWGWLVKMVGWEKAQKIAALPPESRIKVLHKLRAAALQAFQQEMVTYEAAQIAREIPEQLSDLVPTAGGAMGAQGAGELGDGALFMGA